MEQAYYHPQCTDEETEGWICRDHVMKRCQIMGSYLGLLQPKHFSLAEVSSLESARACVYK